MSSFLEKYKDKYHFSVNFYSLFLIATFIPDLTGVNKLYIKYAYWVIKIFLAFLIIRKDKRPLFRFSVAEGLFFMLIVIYAARIFIDVFILPVSSIPKPEWSQATGIIDFIGYVIGILIAFSFRYDPAFHSPETFNFFWVSLSIALVLAYFLSYETLDLDVHNARYDANSTINSIMYGQTGCALALISLYGIANGPSKMRRLLFLLTMFLGLISIAKAGSRSPVIVFALVSIIYLLTRLGKFKGTLIISCFAFMLFFFIQPIMAFLESIGSTITNRLTNMIVEKESSGRDLIYSNTWNLIQEHPLFGSFYVIPKGPGAGGYPHNFLLEVFLATGIAGGILFLILLVITISKALKVIKFNSTASWVSLLYLQIIVYGMFSTGLYTSQDFWALLFLFASMNLSTYSAKPVQKKQVSRSVYLKLQK